jgi:hypothetical protein
MVKRIIQREGVVAVHGGYAVVRLLRWFDVFLCVVFFGALEIVLGGADGVRGREKKRRFKN